MFTSGLPELSFVPLVTSLPAALGSLPLMEALRRWARALCLGALPVALGAVLWAAVAAGEERRREEIRVRRRERDGRKRSGIMGRFEGGFGPS